MKAALLEAFGSPLRIQSIPDPVLRAGELIVDIEAAPVLPYAKQIFVGARDYPLALPMVPGCGAIARVAQVGDDASRLAPGDWIFCDPTLRPRDDLRTSDAALQGWDARGHAGQVLQRQFPDGPFAQRMRLPLENAVPLGPIDAHDAHDAARWCALNTLLIPHGGLRSIQFSPGETLLVSGATGHFGSATVCVALAMGAARVLAAGRNKAALAALVDRYGERIVPVQLSGDEAADRERMREAGHGEIDCVLDFLPPSASARFARAAAMSVRPHGRVALMGGVGLQGGEDLALPYPWLMLNNITIRGQWMYAREDAARVVGLVRSGQLRLDDFAITTFPLDDVNDAIDHAAANAAPFRLTVVMPGRQQ